MGITSADAVRASYSELIAALGRRLPAARVDGVTVQPMAGGPGHELLLGARRDPSFGAVIALGAGGTAAEVLGDVVLGLPPLNERLARRMVESLRIWPLLRGHRGRPGANLDRLLETLIRFSYLVADYPEIAEIEVNPLLATPEDTIALDGRAVIDRDLLAHRPEPFRHLAIRPYPDEYETEIETPDGERMLLRPIMPEDEPLWHEMLDACSEETIYSRFRGVIKHTHEMAARFCFVDYDRELPIVAEVETAGRRRLAGVGRLVAGPDRRRAEYAVLIADPWQGQGLADQLTDHCLAVAAHWGVGVVYAETTPGNRRMIAVLESHGFDVASSEDGLLIGERAARA